MKTYRVAVPAGIGDFSWIWSKLCNVKDAQWEFFVPDTFPYRTKQYVDILPGCSGGLGQHKYWDIVSYMNIKGWTKWVNIEGEDGFIYLEANKHLEAGKPLATWLPDLPTNYHYPLPVSSDFDTGVKTPTLSVHMASLKGIRAWNAWMPETWADFLIMFNKEFPEFTIQVLGGLWDIDTVTEVMGRLPEEFPIKDFCGKTTINDVIKVLAETDYYIGYSSGLNVIRNVLNRQCTALWPKHQLELMYSHVDPENIESRKYLGYVYDNPERIFYRIKPGVKKTLQEVFA